MEQTVTMRNIFRSDVGQRRKGDRRHSSPKQPQNPPCHLEMYGKYEKVYLQDFRRNATWQSALELAK
jgi:hypothetical protein